MTSSALAVPNVLLGEQLPRICSCPEYVATSGHEAIDLAALAGLHLDEWQQYVLIRSLGERADGRWAAPTVGLVVGRQNGKNVLLEARELIGLFLIGEKTIIHSAHEQATSSEHFRRLLERIENVPEFDRRILKVVKGKGSEAIELRGGQRILFKTRTGGGGRGFTVDLIVFDEAMILSASAKAALVPTMAAQSMTGNTQTWYAGSAVDQKNPKHDGLELARIRERGILGHDRIAYFEWSAPGDDPENVPEEIASDPAIWAQGNPGLGIRISPEWINHERTVELGAREFAVERLGIGDWPSADGSASVISVEQWAALEDALSRITGDLSLAFDVSPDRSSAAISAAGTRQDGLRHVETVEHRRGTGWLPQRLAELVARHQPTHVVCDATGPAGSLLPDIQQRGVTVNTVTAKEHAHACGLFYDITVEARLRHLGSPELAAAIKAAAQRPLGDAWAWSRKDSMVDICPLVAATLAIWGAAAPAPEPFALAW